MAYRLAVVGATGVVGKEFLQLLETRKFPVGALTLIASKRSAGHKLTALGAQHIIRELNEDALMGHDIVFITASSEVSKVYAPVVAKAGGLAIDDSSAWRMDPNVPLVVPEVNGDDALKHHGIISTPNCTTVPLVMALHPIHKVNPVRRIVVTTYQAVSGTGRAAMQELRDEVEARRTGQPYTPSVYPQPIAYNLIPQCDAFADEGYTKEEMKVINETRKIMHAPDIAMTATCVRVPVFRCHSEAVFVEFARPISPDEARRILAAAPGVQVVDDPAQGLYPTPLNSDGKDPVFVGRIRRDLSTPNGLAMWIVSDNIRKGAALNAIQIAEAVVKAGSAVPR